ncbi:MAG: hypothetical protein LC792_00405 [Actinobacteria bacterium]|nr:hypothetical protein [Actinomycetota bacterium]
MNLAASYNTRTGFWYVKDTTGTVEIDSGAYDTQELAEGDFQYYRDLYTDPATADETTDEEMHDMPLTGQDTVDTGEDDLTTKAAANLNVPVGLSGKHRTAYLALTDEQKRIYRHHYIAMGQFAQQALDAAVQENVPPVQASPVATVKFLRSDHVSNCACCQGAHVYSRACETTGNRERFDGTDWYRNALAKLPEGTRFQVILQPVAN